jgi:pyruvate dehydrogenase E2 component (dihydrolipoamide acetyltransferase)
MAVEVVMPQMGESIFEGTVTKWLKKTGDRVERDEPLFEISTDKVDAEIQSPASGVLQKILVGEGQTVPIRTIVALIESAGSAETTSKATAAESAIAAPATSAASSEASAANRAGRPSAEDTGPITPLVRRLAQEHNIDLSTVRGTGGGGRITKQDILAAAKSEPSAAAGAPASATPVVPAAPHAALESAVPRERIYFGQYEVQPMNAMRQRIAEHMLLSKRVSPHVYSFDEADVSRVLAARDASRDEFEKRYGTKLTVMPFFVRACVDALRAFPVVNSSVDGPNLVLHRDINIGIAVALESGLIVPVLKNAGDKNFAQLQVGINDLADRARGKKLHPDEVHDSTFSITNPGIFGGLMGLPIINQPNVAILAIGAIQKRPVVIDDAVVARPMVYLTLSYDHRAVDGAMGHQFMGHIKKRLETWDEPLLQVPR